MRIIAYYRVSTKRQKDSGLGLAAQEKDVAVFARRHKGKICAEYTEIETGKWADRPKLQEAIAHARLSKATIVVAKLDRLARDVAFTSALMAAKVKFVACDNEHATDLTIHILAAVAENEALLNSRRTRDALAAAKAKGVLLGSSRPGHWEGIEHLRGSEAATKASSLARTRRAKTAYSFLMPKIRQMRRARTENTYEDIAAKLNEIGHVTTAGKPFTSVAVWRIIKRYVRPVKT